MINAPVDYDTQNAASSKTPIYQVRLGPMRSRLAGAWKLNETSGTRIDWTTKSDLTAVNAPGTAAGKTGANAVQLTAASSQYLYASLNDNHALLLRNESFMVTTWVYLDSKGDDRYIASNWQSAGNNQSWYLRFTNSADRFEFSVAIPTSYAAVANNLGSPSTATWYFIVAWFDVVAHTVNIRVNNGTVNSAAAGSAQMQASTVPFRIGAIDLNSGGAEPSKFWNGRIEQFMLWKRILTQAEQDSLYNGGTGRDFEVLTDPEPLYEFCTSDPVGGEDLGDEVLEPIELIRETTIEESQFALSTLRFYLDDISSVVTTAVAAGIVGYRCRFFASFYNLASSNLTALFSGIVSEIRYVAGKYEITARSYLTTGAEKIILAPAQTHLNIAVNSTDTTFNVEDAAAFADAVSVPQSFRQVALIDTELVEYRGKTQLADGTWNLTSVVRSAAGGYPYPPLFGDPAAHAANAFIKYLPKMGSVIPDTDQAAANWMHPCTMAQQILTVYSKDGLGEFDIPINGTEFTEALTELGETVQFRFISTEGENAKDFLEREIYLVCGAYPTENNVGAVGIKCYPSPSKLHACWKFEETSGTRVDEINDGNGSLNYDLTPASASSPLGLPTSASGKIGTAVQLTAATTQYLWRPVLGLQPAGGSFSVACWVYLDSKGSNRTVCGQWDTAAAADQAWRLLYDSGADRFRFVITDGSTTYTATASTFGSPSTATWYFLQCSFNRSTLLMSISVNGGGVDTTTGALPVPSLEEFRVGASGNGAGTTNYWDGRIDELGLWIDHVLTAAEIVSLYNGGTGVAIESYLTLYPAWTLDQVDTVEDAHIVDRPEWIRNAEKIVNRVIYHYDYTGGGEYVSTFDYKDQRLIDAIGKEYTLEIFSKGIRSRFFTTGFCWFDSTQRFLMDRAKAIIARFGDRAPVISATAVYRKHLLEMSDEVAGTFSEVIDLDAAAREIEDAPLEISVVRHDYQRSVVDLELVSFP